MDLAFSRRNAFQPAALDLATLLARISAAQAATPTARSQLFLDRRPRPVGYGDARIALFTGPLAVEAQVAGASFAAIFSPRQPK
jgi:hypothetical protein